MIRYLIATSPAVVDYAFLVKREAMRNDIFPELRGNDASAPVKIDVRYLETQHASVFIDSEYSFVEEARETFEIRRKLLDFLGQILHDIDGFRAAYRKKDNPLEAAAMVMEPVYDMIHAHLKSGS